MIRILILLLTLVFSINLYSQNKEYYRVQSKNLDSGEYDPQKVAKNPFKVFYDEEAEREFEKILLKDSELKKLFIQEEVDEEGNIFSIREREIYEYYPELGIVIEGGGHGYISAFDIKNKKAVCGNPITYAYSPSHRYRLSGLNIDGMLYYLEEKINDEYVCLGSVQFDGIVSDYYWVDEEMIYYLREQQKDDDSKHWVAYSGRFY